MAETEQKLTGGVIAIQTDMSAEENIASALVNQGVAKTADGQLGYLDDLSFSNLEVLVPLEQDTDETVPNTRVEVTVSNENTGDWKGRVFKYEYRRSNIEKYIPALAQHAQGLVISKNDQTTTDKKITLLKALAAINGALVSELSFTLVTETTQFGIAQALYSNIDKGVYIKANDNSLLYTGFIYIPLLLDENSDLENDEEYKKLIEQAEKVKKNEEAIRNERLKEEKNRRATELAALKEKDKKANEEAKANPPAPTLTPPENNAIKPGDWTGAFDDDLLPIAPPPPADPAPVPPPAIPQPDGDIVPPAPPPVTTPPRPAEKPIRLGGFENYHDTAKKHLVFNPNAADSDEVNFLVNYDVKLDVDKANPDNPYLHNGVSRTVQALNLTTATDDSVILKS